MTPGLEHRGRYQRQRSWSGTRVGDDVAGVNRVVNAIGNMDGPPVCFIGGPGSHDARLVSDAVRLPSSLDEAVAVVAAAVEPDKVRTSR